jgi:glycosyltransferase involved in cell wall biosynthesis
VGRIDPNKRPEEVFALAAALPHRQFIVVCNNVRQLGEAALEEMEHRLPNLMLANQVDLRDIDALFHFSDLLLNTSAVEGFPNTFLQAGMHGLPVISMTVDPDDMLSRFGCGRVANGTRLDLAYQTEALLTDTAAYARASAACSRWVCERHDPDARVAELSAVLTQAIAEHRPPSAARVAASVG